MIIQYFPHVLQTIDTILVRLCYLNKVYIGNVCISICYLENSLSRSIGLRTEILTTITLLMGAALLLGGVLMLRLTEQSLLEQKVAQLRLMTGIIGRSLSDNYNVGQVPSFNLSTLRQLPNELLHEGWWLYDSSLAVVASYDSGQSEQILNPWRQQVRFSREVYELVKFPSLAQLFSEVEATAKFIQPMSQNGTIIGVFEIHYSLRDIRQRLLASQRFILLYVLLYGVVLVSVGYYLFQRNIIRPALNLLRATENVSQGNLNTRLPIAGPTEIAHLADAYNHMVDALEESRSETQDHIEKLQQANQELQNVRDELIRSEKLASVGQLGAGLAHEIGNPLAALIGYLELLKSQLCLEAEIDIVKRSLVEAERMDFLVRELLDFAAPSTDSEALLDPMVVLRETINLLRNQGVFKSNELELRLPDTLPPVRICPNRLQQVFVNLLINAVQASEVQGVISVGAGVEGAQIRVSIHDSGCGISEETIKHLFDPFFTTKKTGRGLGLAISLRIAEDAGGMISVESEPLVGSVFTLSLPVWR